MTGKEGLPLEEKKKRRSLFFRRYEKDGKGVKKEDVITDYTLGNFFKLYVRRFSKLVYVNFLYVFGNFPLLFFILGISGNFSNASVAPVSPLYPIAYGLYRATGNSAATAPLFGLFGNMEPVFSHTTPACYVLFGISALFIITFGLVNTGCAYLIKCMIKGDPIFLFEDFFHAIKQNWKQAVPLGILDLVFCGAGAYALSFYQSNYNTYYILFFCTVAAFIVYTFMRFYLYNILVTFKVSFRQLIKNSFILSILAIGKNFGALLGILLFTGVSFLLFSVFMPFGVIILAMLYFSTVSFIATYAAYPKIKKYMIDPYYPAENPDEPEEPEEDEPVFRDHG